MATYDAYFEAGSLIGRLQAARVMHAALDPRTRALEQDVARVLAQIGVPFDSDDLESIEVAMRQATGGPKCADALDTGVKLALLRAHLIVYSLLAEDGKFQIIEAAAETLSPVVQQLRVLLARQSAPADTCAFVDSVYSALSDSHALGRASRDLLHRSEIIAASLKSFLESTSQSHDHVSRDGDLQIMAESGLHRQRVPSASGPVFNFHGTVGAVQTGTGASATVSSAITAAEAEQIREAMSEIHRTVAVAQDLSDSERTKIARAVANLQDEFGNPRPNRLRIGQLASGVATTIQAVGSLQPAYALLKVALHAVGITVP